MSISMRTRWMTPVFAATLGCGLAVLTAGCNGDSGDGPPPVPGNGPPPTNPIQGGGPSKGYAVKTVSNGGTIGGTVKWTGGAYTPDPLTITKDKEVCQHPGAVDQSLTIDAASKGVANVVVFIKKINKGKAWAAAGRLDNKGCLFNPQVTLHGVASGAMSITNSDAVPHNTHLKPKKNEDFNKMIGKKASVTWGGAGATLRAEKRPMQVVCDLHGWMKAWVWVIAHPYHELSGKDGHYSIGSVPAGSYVIGAWHGLKDEMIWSQPVAVTAGDTNTLNLAMDDSGTLTFVK